MKTPLSVFWQFLILIPGALFICSGQMAVGRKPAEAFTESTEPIRYVGNARVDPSLRTGGHLGL